MIPISNPESLPKQNVFNLSIQCMADLPRIKQEIADKFLMEAPRIAREHQQWSRSRIGREVASIAYKEFEQTMKGKYSSPGYDYFLKCSIEQQYPYFYKDLVLRVKENLAQLNLPEK